MGEVKSKKRVLIVGRGSYIGTAFFNANRNDFDIAFLDSTKPLSVNDYKGFDSVLHVAGIAHVSKKKSMESLYYKVNRDLAIQSATLAKNAGVGQFIFMSSMIVYGGDYPVGKPKIITASTLPSPSDFYGDSKLQADIVIQKLECPTFHVVISRTPMVYGENCKGNYPKLKKLALHSCVLPKIENQRTVVEISTLVRYLSLYIKEFKTGVFFPRDTQPMCTYQVMLNARKEAGKKTISLRLFNPLIRFFSLFGGPLRKMFSTKIYDGSLPLS
jgi:UDP-glucose 4-epimerase